MKIQILPDLQAGVHPIKPIMIAPNLGVVIAADHAKDGAIRSFERQRRTIPPHVPIPVMLGKYDCDRRGLKDEVGLGSPPANTMVVEVG
ncbi:hypothetical protein JQ580_08445 [Bradyrhizobium japonicum]|uniref:hypothetical protein n=1 Tax=Bradyrhizobium japonicum TaxID=375 RepID=UPI001BADF1F2|nr:hypothetical protein [Bradyrhizobium japonicum]MBR0990740.1 hypothetical protein [Bradyrhizobium japonicum]